MILCYYKQAVPTGLKTKLLSLLLLQTDRSYGAQNQIIIVVVTTNRTSLRDYKQIAPTELNISVRTEVFHNRLGRRFLNETKRSDNHI